MKASNVTNLHQNPQNSGMPELTQKQEAAILLLALGKTQTEVAGELDIARETISKWKSKNPRFMAKLNEVKGEMNEALHSRMRSIVENALTAVELGVLEDAKLALEFLKHAKVFDKYRVEEASGLTEPDHVLTELALEQATDEYECKSNSLFAGLLSEAEHRVIRQMAEGKKREIVAELERDPD
jgi:hypothetical protein